MHIWHQVLRCRHSLIETWDVLKLEEYEEKDIRLGGFNRNMGCIEMLVKVLINKNIYSLIETWDVLK